jgi:tetratricopeptide (TPR) repeat protein
VNPASSQANPLDNSNPFARASAMGSAFVGVADDASALLSNPAGLASLGRGELSLNSDFWLVNTFQESALAGMPLAPGSGLGLAFHYLDYGTFEGRDEMGSLAGSYTASRWSGTGGLGLEIVRGFSLGVGLQVDESTLAGTNSSAFIGQVGLLWISNSGFRIGADYNGLGLASSLGAIESNFEAGLSYPIRLSAHSQLLAAASGSFDSGGDNTLNAGMEYSLDRVLFLRTGYQQPLQDNALGGTSGLTAGIGFVLDDFHFDYAYLPYGDLGDSHRISVGYVWGPEPAPASIPALTPPAPKLAAHPAPNSLTVLFDIPSNAVAAGKKLEGEGKLRQASELYLQALRDDPKDISAWEALGELYDQANEKNYAARCFEKALQLEPSNQKLRDWLANYKAGKP